MILRQIKDAVASLTEEEKKELVVLAITLDPERDTVEVLKKMAKAQGVSAPFFHFLTGEPKEVNRILDLYGFSRKKNPKTGVIDHVNLFILFNRQGFISYRFTLGGKQREWMVKALKQLISEKEVKN